DAEFVADVGGDRRVGGGSRVGDRVAARGGGRTRGAADPLEAVGVGEVAGRRPLALVGGLGLVVGQRAADRGQLRVHRGGDDRAERGRVGDRRAVLVGRGDLRADL